MGLCNKKGPHRTQFPRHSGLGGPMSGNRLSATLVIPHSARSQAGETGCWSQPLSTAHFPRGLFYRLWRSIQDLTDIQQYNLRKHWIRLPFLSSQSVGKHTTGWPSLLLSSPGRRGHWVRRKAVMQVQVIFKATDEQTLEAGNSKTEAKAESRQLCTHVLLLANFLCHTGFKCLDWMNKGLPALLRDNVQQKQVLLWLTCYILSFSISKQTKRLNKIKLCD